VSSDCVHPRAETAIGHQKCDRDEVLAVDLPGVGDSAAPQLSPSPTTG